MRAALAIAVLAACSGEPTVPPVDEDAAPRPSIVLVTLDTLRADRVGAYGDSLASTPHLDALASQAALFDRAYTTAPLTLPAHTAMLTGRAPATTGVRDNAVRVPAEVPRVATALRDAGYATGAFVGAYVLDSTWGLADGFDTYADGFQPEQVATATTIDAVRHPGRDVVRGARAWWAEHADAPRFLWVHLFDAHAPWAPSADWPADADPYRGAVFELDRALGPLLDDLGDDVWVVVAGDHGESLWDDGELHHGLVLNRATLRVPLVIRPPGGAASEANPAARPLPPRPAAWAPVVELSPPGLALDAAPDAPRAAAVVDDVVSLLDVAPTLLDAAGLPCPACEGRSLLPAVRGGALPARPAIAETLYPERHFGWAPEAVAIDAATWVARRADGTWAFDAAADPWLQAPLPAVPDALGAAVGALDLSAARAPMSPDEAAALAVLGYVGTAPAEPVGPAPSARDAISTLHRLRLAERALPVAPDQALADLKALTADAPQLVDAWTSLGVAHLVQRQAPEAAAAFAHAVRLAPDDSLVRWNLSLALRAAGDDDALTALARDATARFPSDARWWRLTVDLLARQERPDAVADAARAGLAASPDDPYLQYMLGLSQLQLGDAAAALAALDGAVASGSTASDLPMWRGRALEQLGRVDDAVDAYHAAARARPQDLRPVVAAGLLLANADRCVDAQPFLFTALQRGVRAPEIAAAWQKCGTATGPRTP